MEGLSPAEQLLKAAYERSLRVKLVKRVAAAPPAAAAAAAAKTDEALPQVVKKPRLVVAPIMPGAAAAAATAAVEPLLLATMGASGPVAVAVPALELDPNGMLLTSDWISVEHDSPLVMQLPNLVLEGSSGNNSLVLSLTMPVGSRRFCLNICPYAPAPGQSPPIILYHFNPRGRFTKENGRVIEETIVQDSFANQAWSLDKDRSLRGFPITFGQRFTLRLTFVKHGIEVYIDHVLVSEYRHRLGPPPSPSYLMVPVREESYDRDRENVIVHSVWWGHLEPTSTNWAVASKPAPPVNEFEINTLFVTGLRKDQTEADALRIFQHYAIDQRRDGTPMVQADPSQGSALVRLKFDQHVSQAIQNLNGRTDLESGCKLVVVRAKRKVDS